MLPARFRAQRAEVSRAMAAALREGGAEWWAAWDGLQWSPKNLFDGTPYRGRERMTLAALSLSRGYEDRRWATASQLAAHGHQPRRGERGAVLRDGAGDGAVVAHNAGRVVSSRGQGARHGTTPRAEDGPGPVREVAVRRVSGALASGAVCPVVRDRCECAMPVPEAMLVVVPRDALWGGSASDLRSLIEAIALVTLARLPDFGGRRPPADARLAASMTSVMTLSDLGVAPSEAIPARGRNGYRLGVAYAIALAEDAARLMACADRAEAAASPILRVAKGAWLAAGEGGSPRDVPAEARAAVGAATRAGDSEGGGDGTESPGGPRVPSLEGSPAPSPFGRYRLRDVVEESEHASSALVGGAVGWHDD